MYEGILVDVAFAEFFLAKWLGRQSFLDDLASLDPELYKGLIYLKHYTGNPEDLSLNFTIVDQGQRVFISSGYCLAYARCRIRRCQNDRTRP